jgi:hypothetical protein
MGLFKRSPSPPGGEAAGLDDLVEVAVLERWRGARAVEALREDGIRAAAVDAHGRRPSWSGECTAEVVSHEQRMTVVPTCRVLVHHADAARARRVLCELADD